MGCQSNNPNERQSKNATAPAFAIAEGAQDLDPKAIAADLVARHPPTGMDQRVSALIPGFTAPFYQAGLAGYSDAAMRIIARRHGCPMCVTEALLDRTLLAGGKGFAKADLGDIAGNVPGPDEDNPLVGQSMGSDPQEMATAAQKMIEQGSRSNKEYRSMVTDGVDASRSDGSDSFAGIDINLACPVKKIAKKSRGGHWLREPEGAIKILKAVREVLPDHIPLSVKMRRSFDDTEEMRQNFLYLFDAAYDLGCSWVTVHGRTVEQKYVGPSRWNPLRALVDRNPDRLIFGSGDIWDVNQIFRMIGYTGLTGVSVARGCIGNPWIFRQARSILAGKDPQEPTIAEQRAVLEEHFKLLLAVNENTRDPEYLTARNMRKFGIRFAAHHPNAQEVKKEFIHAKNLDDWRTALERWYE